MPPQMRYLAIKENKMEFEHKKVNVDFGGLNKGPNGHFGKFDSAKSGSGAKQDQMGKLDNSPGNKALIADEGASHPASMDMGPFDKLHADHSLIREYKK